MLNEDVILSLNEHKICTLADFMREDESKLIKIMDIDGKWISYVQHRSHRILTFMHIQHTSYTIQFYFI